MLFFGFTFCRTEEPLGLLLAKAKAEQDGTDLSYENYIYDLSVRVDDPIPIHFVQYTRTLLKVISIYGFECNRILFHGVQRGFLR